MSTPVPNTHAPLLAQIAERLDRLEEGLKDLLTHLGVEERTIMPVLVAAVHASFPEGRIVAVRRLGPDGRPGRPDSEAPAHRDAWSHAGRLSLFDSHRLR